MSSGKAKTALIWIILVAGLLYLLQQSDEDEELAWLESLPREGTSRFFDDLRGDQISAISTFAGRDEMVVYPMEDVAYRTRNILTSLEDDDLRKLNDVEFFNNLSPGASVFGESSDFSGWLSYLLIGAVIFLVVMFFLKRVSSGGVGGDILQMRQSKARVFDGGQGVTFAQVGGCEEAKEELRDVIDFLNDPKRWLDAGARLPRGILLEGPPGCGKTLLARAVAGESSAKFFLVSASEFVEMFIGVGAARVRDLFEQALKEAPAIVFIDELDAVGRKRGSGIGASHDEREQTLNQILVSMDGFEPNDRVVVLAATNRADILDQALIRPGRFDRRVVIPLPTRADRLEILTIHSKKVPLAVDVDLEKLADRTDGLNGAQLENLVNEATLIAVRRARQNDGLAPKVGAADFERILAKRKEVDPTYNQLDAILIESVTQLSSPTGKAVVRIAFDGGEKVEGTVLWMDSAMIKLVTTDGREVIVAKQKVNRIEALEGTETIDAADVRPDVWLNHTPDLA